MTKITGNNFLAEWKNERKANIRGMRVLLEVHHSKKGATKEILTRAVFAITVIILPCSNYSLTKATNASRSNSLPINMDSIL